MTVDQRLIETMPPPPPPPPPEDPAIVFDDHGHATWEQDGFTLCARLVTDEDPDLSYLGEYSETPGPHAIDLSERPGWSSRQHRYFNPGNPDYAEEDLRQMQTYGDRWWMLGVVVEARKADVVLGGSSVWGVQSHSEKGYFVELARDLAAEAVAEARAKLAELCR